jgi:hypothetical protein
MVALTVFADDDATNALKAELPQDLLTFISQTGCKAEDFIASQQNKGTQLANKRTTETVGRELGWCCSDGQFKSCVQG